MRVGRARCFVGHKGLSDVRDFDFCFLRKCPHLTQTFYFCFGEKQGNHPGAKTISSDILGRKKQGTPAVKHKNKQGISSQATKNLTMNTLGEENLGKNSQTNKQKNNKAHFL